MSIYRIWRRRLKRLLVSTLICTAFLAAYCTWRGLHGHRQRQIVAALRDYGAHVNYAHDEILWARKLLDRSYYDDVDTVDLHQTQAGGRQLALVGQLRGIETLRLNDTQVTDADLSSLELPRLKTLSLWDTQIGDAGLAWLSGHEHLRALGLSGTRITDAALCELCRLPSLQRLHLARTEVTDDGLVRFNGSTEIKFLDLAGTKLTDAGLVHLGKMRQLVFLWLDDTEVTDAGLAYLKDLSRLKSLQLTNTRVTRQGVLDLQLALPQVGIKISGVRRDSPRKRADWRPGA